MSATATKAALAVPIEAIILDSDTQARAGVNPDVVLEYREALRERGAKFPPVDLFEDEDEPSRYWIGDGFYRVLAFGAEKRRTIPSLIRPGGRRAAVLHAVGANDAHGQPRSDADKRRAVELMLDDPEWAALSDSELARQCKVSHPFVAKVRAARLETVSSHAASPAPGRPRKGADGRTINTANIGQRKVKDKATPQANGHAAPPAGKSLVDGVLADDPPDIAERRAAGKIAPDVVPEVTGAPPEPEPPAETNGHAAAPTPDPDDLPDEEWLASLPLYGRLAGAARKWFAVDALLYRTLEPARKTFAHQASRALAAARRKGQDGEYAYRLALFLKLDHPRHWNRCPAPADGGCGGSGTLGTIGRCPKCHGRGYWIQ